MNVYQTIRTRSLLCYNRGLECAGVRNLSQAVKYLKMSVRCDKNNIEARNLLGLCYYEMGEYVLALREWVISENLKAEDNPATRYMKAVQSDITRTGKYTQCVKKFNMALSYANSGSEDLAVIQLKKVCSMNPKYVKAHLLLALLYIHQEQYPQAKEVLKKIDRVDAGNVDAQRYMQEVQENINKNPSRSRKKSVADDSVEYKSGSETIIRPAYFKDNATISTIINIVFGIAVGFLIAFFLVVPGVRRQASAESAAKLVEANNTISTKNVTIRSYQDQIDELNEKIEKAEKNSSKSEGNMNFYKNLLQAYVKYENKEYEEAGEILADVDESKIEKDFKKAYTSLKEQVNNRYLRILYKDAAGKYNQAEYEEAIKIFEKIINVDEEYGDGDALYFLAQSYRMNGDSQKAIMMYQKLIDQYPDTYKARNAGRYMDQLKNN